MVIVKEDDGSWRAFLCTDPEASVEAIVQAILDRWAIEQNFHDLKEVEGIEQVQLRRVWSNVGALNLNLWVHTLVELWAWDRPAEAVERPERPARGMMPLGGLRTPIVARRCSERCWRRNFSGVGAAGRCRRKSGTCWIEWSGWWPDNCQFLESADAAL